MAPDNTSKTVSVVSFFDKHSLSIRIWHWVTYLALTASLITVLLASTLFKTSNNVSMVQDQLQHRGATITKDQARGVAHEYSDKLWDTHKIIGYVLSFLLLSRLVIEIAQPSDEKMKNKLRTALGFQAGNKSEKYERGHYLMVKGGYLIFYLAILVMALTGLGLAFEDAPYLKDIQNPLRSVHSFLQYFIYGYILFHIVGVILAETGAYRGIVSRMIHRRELQNSGRPL